MFTIKKYTAIFFFSFFALLAPCFALAHQPRIVEEGSDAIAVENPEISQAFYAVLTDRAHTYEINSEKPFTLYANILAPRLKNATTTKDISAMVYQKAETSQKLLAILAGPNSEWTEFHERFANDDYYKGPEFRQELPAGNYFIKIISPCNPGLSENACVSRDPKCGPEKYVLAIGEKESWTPANIFKTIVTLPAEKRFFNKSVFLAYWNLTGALLFAALLVMATIIFLLVRILKKRK